MQPEATAARQCGRWRSWWHRRLRRLDREMLLPALRTAVAEEYAGDAEEAHQALQLLWVGHMVESDHWTCPCAEGSRRGVL